MSTNLQSIIKWMPQTLINYEDIFNRCKNLRVECYNLIQQTNEIVVVMKKIRPPHYYHHHNHHHHDDINENNLPIKEIDLIATKLEKTVESFEKSFTDLNKITDLALVVNKKVAVYKELMWKTKLQLCYFIQSLLHDLVGLFVQYGDESLRLLLRISLSYNDMLSMDTRYDLSKNINYVCNNTCPYVMFPLKKYSVTRLLQILSTNRAEYCCHKLIDCLLQSYKIYDNSDDENSSDNSSFEIYMALTKHLSPSTADSQSNQNKPSSMEKQPKTNSNNNANFENIDELITSEQKNIVNLLKLTQQIAPVMMGKEALKKSKSGDYKLSAKTIRKVLEYYDQMLWAEVGNYLEHVILWWAHNPLSAKPPSSSQNLQDWILNFIPTANVPAVVLSALTSLTDALTVYITTTLWDQSFRRALVASRTSGDPQTGPLFGTVLQELVHLCNLCESTSNWIVGAPLDELPIVEQIPVLHRLDHSIHTIRLWTISECRRMASAWNVAAFFTITHKDTVNCLTHLNRLKLADHTVQIEKGGMAVHVEVCVLMRAKLVSEVHENLAQLKEVPTECVDCLASICKIINLANLQMIFPPKSFWSARNNAAAPNIPCLYVEQYLEKMLVPVLKAIDNETICNKILTLICESWLDHIYTNKIKFSRWGARQLLCDFASVNIWIEKNPILSEYLRNKLGKNEVLRRCEGVGKLLLRCPGERLKMLDKKMIIQNNVEKSTNNSNNNTENDQHQQMPAEMYVPNQEQWLALRALKNKASFNPFCC